MVQLPVQVLLIFIQNPPYTDAFECLLIIFEFLSETSINRFCRVSSKFMKSSFAWPTGTESALEDIPEYA